MVKCLSVEVDSFNKINNKQINDKLTKFCTELTGITQQMVKTGVYLQEALEKFD